MPQDDATFVAPLCRTRNDPVVVAIDLGVGRQANDGGPSVGFFDKVSSRAIPKMELCLFVNESCVRVEG